ncbi:MAG: leucine-rich repeat protein, partial [Alistipes sp.]|nr:leucine-rich repeat protein [Alistipes sp.]
IVPVAALDGSTTLFDAIYTLYPYDKDAELSDSGITFTLPAVQTYTEGSFGRGANAMVAVSRSREDHSMLFRNIGGSLKLQLWGNATVKRIRVKGNNNEILAGGASVMASYGATPALEVYNGGVKNVELDCGNGVALSSSISTPTEFWVALPPVTFDKGFTVEVECADGSLFTKSTSKQVVIERNTIQPMAAFEVVATPAKPANNEIWYTTTDGNQAGLKTQSFNVSVTSHERRDDKWVVTFSGALTTIGMEHSSTGAFENSSNLVSIALPDSVTKVYDYTFYECCNLQSVELSNNLQLIGYMAFYNCISLTEITLPASVTNIDVAAFYDCRNLTRVNSLATTPPALGDDVFTSDVTIYVPESAIGAYIQNKSWSKYNIATLSGEGTDDAEMYAPNDPNYNSTDYSANGQYVTLQSATDGNGIDVVLMGDGYSDRQVASGRYEADMRKAMEVFFSKEPFTSFRYLFNVYMVMCVSKREGCSNDYVYGETALNCKIKSDGISVSADTGDVYSHAKEVFGEQKYEYNDGPRIDESTLIVIMNSNAYAGVCYMSQPKSNTTKSYGNGSSLSFFSLCGNDELFANLLIHEACGHGFAKLGDEYFSSGNGAINNRGYYEMKDFEQWGWYKNVDSTIGEPLTTQTIKWRHFLTDYRYADLVGIYEGAYTFAKNAYRPSEDSIMRHVRGSDGEFNAPSREAIYYRIHKLAYGDSWVYNFEDFAAYDAINRN